MELRQHFFSKRSINLRNSLDEETVTATASSLNSFNNNLAGQTTETHEGSSRGGQVMPLDLGLGSRASSPW